VTIFTTGERFTLDANVLVYAVDTKAGERHRLACEILDDSAAAGTCVLTLQALAEFFSVATRKGRMPIAQAIGQVRDLQAVFPVAAATPATLNDAVTALSKHGIAFWDADAVGLCAGGRLHASTQRGFSARPRAGGRAVPQSFSSARACILIGLGIDLPST
jgi:predicted nucleic acid-binding protein